MGKPKRIGIFADLHCGHRAGLAHPNWHVSGGTPKGKVVRAFQQEMWRKFTAKVKAAGHIDVAVWNGDLIDGRGERSGGTELIETDREEQAMMAARIIEFVGVKKNLITYGTPYHSGYIEDWENSVAREVGAEIHSHLFLDVNGVMFDFKHKVGASSIPHGRSTPAKRERLWNLIWAEREEDGQPKADVIMRSHVHYYDASNDAGYYACVTPALQAAFTKYGARQCSGTVDFGFLTWEITDKKAWREVKACRFHEIKLNAVKQVPVKA